VWSSGQIWFKKDWGLLEGTWEDEDSNFIEVKKNGQCKYVKGYGPFDGEVVGFKRVRIKLPNNSYMTGTFTEEDTLVWDNGGKWKRYSDKGCVLM